MSGIAEKGGGTFEGVKLLLCENPLPRIDEAIAAAQAEVPHGNYYTEPYSAPLRQLISERLGSGFMRVTTALPEDNQRFIAALEQVLLCGSTAMEQGG